MKPATTSSPGAEQAAGRPCRSHRSSFGPGVIPGPFGLKIFSRTGRAARDSVRKGRCADEHGHGREPGRRAGRCGARRGAGDRRDDLCLVRGPGGEEAQQARRRHRDGQLRHRDRRGELPGRAARHRADLGGRAGRLHRRAARAPGGEPADPRRSRTAPRETAALRQRLLVSLALAIPVVALAMVPALQFRNWQWACAGARLPGRGVGSVAVPPRRRRQRPARRRDHGHADLGRGRPRRTCGRCTRCSSAPRAGRACG